MNHQCQQIRDVMDSFLSDELLVETNHAVLAHLATCTECSAEAQRRRLTRELLALGVAVPDEHVDSVRQRVESALNRETGWLATARYWGVAAALALATGIVAWLLATGQRPADWIARLSPARVDAAAYRDSVADHIACALTTPAGVRFDPARVARRLEPPFSTLAQSIGVTHGAYEVVDVHTCRYRERRYAHAVLRGEGTTVSLFVETGTRGSLPATASVEPLGPTTHLVHRRDESGYRVAATETVGHKAFVVFDGRSPVREALTDELLLTAVKYLATLER